MSFLLFVALSLAVVSTSPIARRSCLWKWHVPKHYRCFSWALLAYKLHQITPILFSYNNIIFHCSTKGPYSQCVWCCVRCPKSPQREEDVLLPALLKKRESPAICASLQLLFFSQKPLCWIYLPKSVNEIRMATPRNILATEAWVLSLLSKRATPEILCTRHPERLQESTMFSAAKSVSTQL